MRRGAPCGRPEGGQKARPYAFAIRPPERNAVTEALLEFSNVVKRYGDTAVVNGISFTVAPGEFFTLLGPSGCGKTTTLRLLAGLETPDAGEITLAGRCLAAPARGIWVPTDKREMGMVFQSYAIWPHLTVFENVAFPLWVRGERGPE